MGSVGCAAGTSSWASVGYMGSVGTWGLWGLRGNGVCRVHCRDVHRGECGVCTAGMCSQVTGV